MSLLKSSAFGWSFGPSISLPIFDAGLRRSRYEVAQIAQKSAVVSYEKPFRLPLKKWAMCLRSVPPLIDNLESQCRLQKNYQETYKIAYARFRSGLDDYLSVLDAERSLFGNQQSILGLEQQKVISQIQLYQVLGGGASLTARTNRRNLPIKKKRCVPQCWRMKLILLRHKRMKLKK